MECRRTGASFEREKEAEERRMVIMAGMLATYKKEVANCAYLAKFLRQEEERLEMLGYRLQEEAEQADSVASLVEEEANRLERELQDRE